MGVLGEFVTDVEREEERAGEGAWTVSIAFPFPLPCPLPEEEGDREDNKLNWLTDTTVVPFSPCTLRCEELDLGFCTVQSLTGLVGEVEAGCVLEDEKDGKDEGFDAERSAAPRAGARGVVGLFRGGLMGTIGIRGPIMGEDTGSFLWSKNRRPSGQFALT